MKKLKVILLAGLIAAALTGIYVNGNCTATATCGATCSINNMPTGGTSQCTGSARQADCKAWDANGNLCCSTGCRCSPFFACYIMIGSTCC
jgi:hypothetical protein